MKILPYAILMTTAFKYTEQLPFQYLNKIQDTKDNEPSESKIRHMTDDLAGTFSKADALKFLTRMQNHIIDLQSQLLNEQPLQSNSIEEQQVPAPVPVSPPASTNTIGDQAYPNSGQSFGQPSNFPSQISTGTVQNAAYSAPPPEVPLNAQLPPSPPNTAVTSAILAPHPIQDALLPSGSQPPAQFPQAPPAGMAPIASSTSPIPFQAAPKPVEQLPQPPSHSQFKLAVIPPMPSPGIGGIDASGPVISAPLSMPIPIDVQPSEPVLTAPLSLPNSIIDVQPMETPVTPVPLPISKDDTNTFTSQIQKPVTIDDKRIPSEAPADSSRTPKLSGLTVSELKKRATKNIH